MCEKPLYVLAALSSRWYTLCRPGWECLGQSMSTAWRPSRCPAHSLDQDSSFYGAHKDVSPPGRGHEPQWSGLVDSTKTCHSLVFRSCVHTSKGRLRTQGHYCAVSYWAVNNTALQTGAGTAQDTAAASTRDKNYSKYLVTVLLYKAEKQILIQYVQNAHQKGDSQQPGLSYMTVHKSFTPFVSQSLLYRRT